MINLTGALIEQYTIALMLTSVRFMGLLLTAPMLSFRAFPICFRVRLSVLIGFLAMPILNSNEPLPQFGMSSYFSVGVELAIGAFIGFAIRMGLIVIDIAAEVLSFLSGFSYASTMFRDPVLESGLVAQFLGLVTLAMTFALNIHLILIDIVLQSFKTVPFGTWPSNWSAQSLFTLMTQSFQLGLILSMPILLVYLMFNLTQAFLGRTSPQLNLFSVGFAFTIPLAFLVLTLILPDLQLMLMRAIENPLRLVRDGMELKLGR